ncbi:hypothetical protein LP420_08395 [Massilia sp. B-10]|nr:hypothetical protein LP420_08395 [Massilia sp. B-10]
MITVAPIGIRAGSLAKRAGDHDFGQGLLFGVGDGAQGQESGNGERLEGSARRGAAEYVMGVVLG